MRRKTRIKELKVRENIGYKIKESRIRKGVSQKELSNKVNITRTFLGLIENAKRVPSYNTLQKIALCLECDPINLAEESKLDHIDPKIKTASLLRKLLRSGDTEKIRKLGAFIDSLE